MDSRLGKPYRFARDQRDAEIAAAKAELLRLHKLRAEGVTPKAAYFSYRGDSFYD
jgi:hypothetical protein